MNIASKMQGELVRERIIDAIRSFRVLHGYSPSVREVGKMTGIKSTATVHSHLKRLEKDGYITRESSCPRTVKVVRDI